MTPGKPEYSPPNPQLKKQEDHLVRCKPGIANQPIAQVEWVDPAELTANDFNPNRVQGNEMRLLTISLLESGWLAPVVVTPDNEVVDGFHRFTVASRNPEVLALGDGKIPVVRWQGTAAEHRMVTVRMNRARGNHYVVAMAELVSDLVESGLSDEEIAARMQMDPEEVFRLKQRGQTRMMYDDEGEMIDTAEREFGSSWAPDYGEEAKQQAHRDAMGEIYDGHRKGRGKTKPVVGGSEES